MKISLCPPTFLNASILRPSLLLGALLAAHSSHGLTVLSGPSFTPATNAPLAGLLSLTTDVETRVSVSIDDGASQRELNFFDYSKVHSITLLGFKSRQTNSITVTIRDKFRNAFTAPTPLMPKVPQPLSIKKSLGLKTAS